MFKAKDNVSIFAQIKDHSQTFPREAFISLNRINVLALALPHIFGERDDTKRTSQGLLDLLFEMGRGDISVGRIFEGHINALLLIDTFGTSEQKEIYFRHAAQGNLFGVWNTEKERLVLNSNGEDFTLKGAKIFCTGALNLQFAIVTANIEGKDQMLVVPLNSAFLKEDWSMWNPIGMRSTVSCRIDFSGTNILKNQFLGKYDDYYREPYFSWGAARFSAVQAGGAQSILDKVMDALTISGRAGDPYQKMRLGKMAILMETAKLWIANAEKVQENKHSWSSSQSMVNYANMMRSIVLDICEEIISLAEKSVGLKGTMINHPLEKPVRDLRVYLKQAGPDAALADVGVFMTNKHSGHIDSKQLLGAPLIATEQLGKQMGTSLVLAPHPDDESLGCGGLIQYLVSQNEQVYVCLVTSGDASHPNSIKYAAEKLADLREKEAIAACKFLGIDATHIIFLRAPDSLLENLKHKEKFSLILKLAKILEELKISSLILPWRRDPHPDHKESYELGRRAVEIFENDIQLIEYPIWLWKNSQIEDWPIRGEVAVFRLDIQEMLPKKIKAIYAHKSQTSDLIQDDPEGFILNEDLLAPFFTPFEFYFFEKNKEMPSLSEDYFDALYSNNSDPWNFRSSAYEKQKYETINAFLKDRTYKNGLELGCSIGIHTSYLAAHCDNLLAIDISEEAIITAKNSNDLPNVHFEKMDMIKDFPKGPFQFISMCELGYYFNRETLMSLYTDISENLSENGNLLMVHWTSYVREYPLNGNSVHELFQEFNDTYNLFNCISTYIHDRYELMLWKKK